MTLTNAVCGFCHAGINADVPRICCAVGETIDRIGAERDELRTYAVKFRDMLRRFVKVHPGGFFETPLDEEADTLMAKFAWSIGERPDALDRELDELGAALSKNTAKDALHVGDDLDALAEQAQREFEHHQADPDSWPDAIVRKLVDALESARDGFINLRPESGPMHQQMTKHIEAIAAALDGCETMARSPLGVLTPPEGDVARPCCGEYFTCQRPCTPRGEQRAYRGADEELRLKVDAIVEWIDSMAGEELSSEERWPSIVRSVRSQVQGLVSPPSADATDATAVHSQVNSDTARLDWLEKELQIEQDRAGYNGLFRRNVPITRDGIDKAMAKWGIERHVEGNAR